MQWCWVTAQLYEQQIFKGVFALTQACWQPVVHTTALISEVCIMSKKVLQCNDVAQLYEQQIFIGQRHTACCEPVCSATLNSGDCILPWTELQALVVGHCPPV